MTTSILINALGQALFESCGQALIIYVALQIFMQLFPAISSKYKYDINYLGLTIISCWFLANLVKIYLHNLAQPHYNLSAYNNHIGYANAHLPSLLQRIEAYIIKYAKYITGLYITGLILHSFRLLGGLMNIHFIRKQKNLSEDSIWSAKVNELTKKLKIVKTVSLYFSEHIQIPLTIGYFKPIVIFPLALINNLESEQVEAILMHELAHIKRYDYLLNILQCIMETILCFNPFVWLISKTIREEREYCCDDMVINEDFNHFTYSKALLVIAEQSNQSYTLAMASTGSKKYPLLNRIKRLNTMKTNDSLPKFHLLAIIAVISLGILLAWGVPQYSVAKTKSVHTVKILAHKFNCLVSPATEENKKVAAKPAPLKTRIIIHIDTASYAYLNDTNKQVKTKIKIVVVDDKGNKKEYNSVAEMPAPVKDEFLQENPSFPKMDFIDTTKFAFVEKFKMTPQMKMQMNDIKIKAEQMSKQFNSPEWKKQMADIKAQSEIIAKQVNTPEWRKQMADIQIQSKKMQEQFNSDEWKKQQDAMVIQAQKITEKFNSPEWRKQMADMKMQSKKMNAYFNSPQWKKQVEQMSKQGAEMSKQINSPQFKNQMEDMQKEMFKEDKDIKKAQQDSVKDIK